MTDEKEQLGTTMTDIVAAMARGGLGAIPLAGSVMAEIFDITIPNQRMDRVCNFVLKLNERINTIELEALKSNKYFVDLLEDGVRQATKSLTEERNAHIANFISTNRDINEAEYSIKKKLLRILEELTDDDIEILKYFENRWSSQVREKKYTGHLLPQASYDALSDEEKYKYRMRTEAWDTHVHSLVQLRLLEAERELPNIDNTNRHLDRKTGLPKVTGHKITHLGKLLLSAIAEKL